jgi:hypothetical protein
LDPIKDVKGGGGGITDKSKPTTDNKGGIGPLSLGMSRTFLYIIGAVFVIVIVLKLLGLF